MKLLPDHATPARYNRGCRCARCRTAIRQYTRAQRRKRRAVGVMPAAPKRASCARHLRLQSARRGVVAA